MLLEAEVIKKLQEGRRGEGEFIKAKKGEVAGGKYDSMNFKGSWVFERGGEEKQY